MRCFLKVLPEIELVCDKIEDLLSNKYLKGKRANVKLELKEELVAEIDYYIRF